MDEVTTFAQAAESHLDDVYAYLVWFTGDRFVAEELTAETFERALRLWHRFDPGRGTARTWLCQVARTTALDHFRSEKRRRAARRSRQRPSGSSSGSSTASRPSSRSALAHLTAGEREVIALRVVLDLDARSAAGMLGISTTNCTTRLNRALAKLEEALGVAA